MESREPPIEPIAFYVGINERLQTRERFFSLSFKKIFSPPYCTYVRNTLDDAKHF